jgi:hypothetical protein
MLFLPALQRLRHKGHVLEVVPEHVLADLDAFDAAIRPHVLRECPGVGCLDLAVAPLPERPAHHAVLIDRHRPPRPRLVLGPADRHLLARPVAPEHHLVGQVGVVDEEHPPIVVLREAVRVVEIEELLEGADTYVVLLQELPRAAPRVGAAARSGKLARLQHRLYDTQVPHTVDDELHADADQKKSHDSRQGVDAARSEVVATRNSSAP